MKTKINLSLSVILLIALVVFSCKKNANLSSDDTYSAAPVLPEDPDDYVASSNDDLAALGRVLFYDKALSLNNSVSCASCHQQSRAFCDNQRFSTGLENIKTARNSPSIFAKTSRMFWDGRASNLKDLVLRPIKNHVEMKFESVQALVSKISGISYYKPLFAKAFNGSNAIDSTKVKSALAEFLTNFDFSDNKFKRSQFDETVLSASEKLGKTVFFNKGKCFNCHHIESSNIFPGGGGGGYGFTDGSFNIGLDEVYSDNGMGVVTKNASDNGVFMVPVLLNVEYTAPYMHDGRFKTLEEVVEHYNSGIQQHPNLDFNLRDLSRFENMSDQEIIRMLDKNHNGEIDSFEIPALPPVKLGLSSAEKKGLVDFLKTLSDPSILTKKMFSNPFLVK
jgi:cytochrome c peroxidase